LLTLLHPKVRKKSETTKFFGKEFKKIAIFNVL
jgi:hypothetical protein